MKVKTYIKLILFSVFTGATFNLAKYTTAYFSALTVASWRFGLASMIMIILLFIGERLKYNTLKENGWMYIILGIVGIFGFNALFFLGIKFTSPINGALIMATNPLLTTILSKFILHTTITKNQATGVGFSFVGVIMVITQGSWLLISSLAFSIGDIFILLGNACWALYGVLGKRYIKSGSILSTTTFTMVVGTLFLILVASFNPTPIPVTSIPIMAWLAVLFMAFFTTVLGYLFWNQGVAEIGVTKTSIFFNLVPVVTMMFTLIMGDRITWIQIIGAVLVISGVMIASGFKFNRAANRKCVPNNVIPGHPTNAGR